MPMMFFYFLKIIFDISTSKRSKKYKPHSILAKKKKKIQIWTKRRYKRNTKRSLCIVEKDNILGLGMLWRGKEEPNVGIKIKQLTKFYLGRSRNRLI
jgi:hypothetical protein